MTWDVVQTWVDLPGVPAAEASPAVVAGFARAVVAGADILAAAPSPAPPSPWLDEAAVAARAGVSDRTVRRWLASDAGREAPGGPVDASRGAVRHRWRWHVDTVDGWIRAMQNPETQIKPPPSPSSKGGASLADYARSLVGHRTRTGHEGRGRDTRRNGK